MKNPLIIALTSCLALFGCLNSPTNPDENAPKGSAQIRLPEVPAGVLAKGARDIVTSELIFQISVSGSGMDTLTQSWSALEFGGKTVTMAEIPSGHDRNFTGRILRNGKVTHQGTFFTDVQASQTVFVPLVLRDVRTGRAEICVEVEGWPNSPRCMPIDTLPQPELSLAGCWNLVAKATTTTLNGLLSLDQSGQMVKGTLNNQDGSTYWITGNQKGRAWYLTLTRANDIEIDYPYDSLAIRPMLYPMPPIGPIYTSRVYLKIDSLNAGNIRMSAAATFEGSITDSTFSRYLGTATGWGNSCNTVPPDSGVWTLPDTATVWPQPDSTMGWPEDSLTVWPGKDSLVGGPLPYW